MALFKKLARGGAVKSTKTASNAEVAALASNKLSSMGRARVAAKAAQPMAATAQPMAVATAKPAVGAPVQKKSPMQVMRRNITGLKKKFK